MMISALCNMAVYPAVGLELREQKLKKPHDKTETLVGACCCSDLYNMHFLRAFGGNFKEFSSYSSEPLLMETRLVQQRVSSCC